MTDMTIKPLGWLRRQVELASRQLSELPAWHRKAVAAERERIHREEGND